MRLFVRDTQGISVIIGALMLTLIVVSAATAFAIFTSQKQKDIQDSELFKTQRTLENIDILGMNQLVYTTSGNLTSISFNIGSMHAKDSRITSLSLNGYLIAHFNLTRQNLSIEPWKLNFTTGIYEKVGLGSDVYYPLNILAHEHVVVSINNTSWCVLRPQNENITTNDPIQFDISTNLVNTFSKTFIPPTAIIKIETESLPAGPSFYILDGSASDHPGEGYIIKWEWNVTNTTSPAHSTYPYGRKTQIDPTFGFGGPGNIYWVNLTVTDNFGMNGFSAFQYKP